MEENNYWANNVKLNLFLKSQLVVFLLFLFGGGLLSIALKFELSWDFANYHYYNPWAFLNGRIGKDIAVAGVNAFYNPLMDLPLYYLTANFNAYPNFIYFIQGLWFGALGFVLYKIAELFFEQNTALRKYRIPAVLLFGLSGYAVFFQIGTSTNEIMVSLLIMISLWLLLREIFVIKSGQTSIFFVSGLIAGMALGLKLTVAAYCVALGVTLILFAKNLQKPVKNIFIFALSGLLGFLLLDGFWMWKMWTMYHNPFFPFANEWFKSEYFEIRNYYDDRFIPKSLAEFLFLPFYWAFNTHREDGSVIVIDFRWAIFSIVILFVALKYALAKTKINLPLMFVFTFMLAAYVIWINTTAVGRYMIPLELCSAIILVKAADYLCPQSDKWSSWYWQLVSALGVLLFLTPIFSQIWGCRHCVVDEKLFQEFVAVQGVKIPDNTLLLFYNYPSAALLPYFNRTAKNIQGVSIKQKNYLTKDGKEDMFNANPKWAEMKEEIIRSHQGLKVAVIAVEKESRVREMLETEPLLKGMVCRELRSNIIPAYHFCVAADKQSEIFQ